MLNFFELKKTPAGYIRNIRNKHNFYKLISVILGLSLFFYHIPLEILVAKAGGYLVTLSNSMIIHGFLGLGQFLIQPLGLLLFTYSGTVATVLISLALIAYVVFKLKPAALQRVENFESNKKSFFEKVLLVAHRGNNLDELVKKLEKVKQQQSSSFFKDYLMDLLVNTRQSFYTVTSIIVAILNISLLFFTPAFLLSTPLFLVTASATIIGLISWLAISTVHRVLENELTTDNETLSKMSLIMDGYLINPVKNHDKPSSPVQELRLTRLFSLYKSSMAEPDNAERDINEFKEKLKGSSI